MTEKHDRLSLPILLTDCDGATIWSERDWPRESRGGMLLSPRMGCSSLRLRTSDPGYASDWHVAGDPTLIIIQQGQLKIILHDQSGRTFGPGDAFIAADRLPEGQTLDPAWHGHRAEVVGDQVLKAIHIKLVLPLDR